MAEDILGISGHLDISDIETSINEMIANLEKIGVKTEVLSKRMSEAMREIANSTDDSVTKQKKALDVLEQGYNEAKAALANYPEQLRIARNEMEQTEVATEKLRKQYADMNAEFQKQVIGSERYNELRASMNGIEQQIQNNTAAHQAQALALNQIEEGYNGLISLLGVANTGTAANAIAHTAVTSTVLVEAGAHTENASKIVEETKVAQENSDIKSQQAENSKRVADAIQLEIQTYDALSKKVSEGKLSNEEYSRSVEDLRDRIKSLQDEQLSIRDRLVEEQGKAMTWDANGESQGNMDLVNSLSNQYDILEGQIGALKGVLNEVEAAWNSTHQKAASSAKETTEEVENTTKAIKEEEAEASKEPSGFKAQWNAVHELWANIVNLTKELHSYEEEYDRLAEKPGFDPQSKKAKELEEVISRLKKEIADLQTELQDTNDAGGFFAKTKLAIFEWMTGHGKFQKSLGDMKTALGGLVQPFAAATGGALGFTKALWSMAATPIGAILSAIILALQALFTWFKKSADGQKAFSKVLAYFGSLLSSVTDILVKFGSYLYHAFTDAKGPMNDFAKSFVSTFKSAIKAVANLLSGLGGTLKGIFTGDWDTFKKGLTQVWDGLKDSFDTVIGSVKTTFKGALGLFNVAKDGIKTINTTNLLDSFKEIGRKASEASKLAGQQLEAEKSLAEAKVKEKELDIEIAKEREKIYTLTGKEKDAQIEKVKNLLKEKYDGQIAAHKTLLEIQQKRNKLHTVSLEDLAKERELRGQLLGAQAQQAASTRMLVRMQQANLRSMNSGDKKSSEAESRYNEVIRKNILERAKAAESMEERITAARIAAMDEGTKKVLAERENAFKKELAQIESQHREAIEAERNRQKAEFEAQEKVITARGGKARQWDDSMFDANDSNVAAINDSFKKLLTETIAKQITQSIELENNLINSHSSYIDKKKKIDKDYKNSVEEIELAITEAEKRGDGERVEALKRSRLEVEREHAKSQASLSLQKLKESPEYIRAFEDLQNTSAETIEYLISQFEKAKEVAATSLNPEDLREYTDALQRMYDELNSRNPFKALAESALEMKRAHKEVEDAQKRLDAIRNGENVVKSMKYDPTIDKVVMVYWDEEAALKALIKAKDKEAKATNNHKKANESAEDSINDFASAITNLGNAMGGVGGQTLSIVGDVMTFAMSCMNAINFTSEATSAAIKAIEKASVILAVVSAAIELLQTISSFYEDSHERYEKLAAEYAEINKLKDAVADYRTEMMKAQLEQERWFSSTGLSNLTDQYILSNDALTKYANKLAEIQATYENENGGGWLTDAVQWVGEVLGDVLTTPFRLITTAFDWIGDKIGGFGKDIASVIGKGAGYVVGGAPGFVGQVLKAVEAQLSEGQSTARQNLRIETRSSSSGFLGTGIGGHDQETENLEDWVRENMGANLFDANGFIDINLGREVIDKFGDKLVGETKETLEKLIELKEEYDKFQEQLQEYISELYSPLSDDMVDALYEWYDKGTDAMDNFKEYASDTFASIGKEITKTLVNALIFDSYKEKLKDLYTQFSITSAGIKGSSASQAQKQAQQAANLAALEKGILTVTDEFIDESTQTLPLLQNAVQMLNDGLKERGLYSTDKTDQQNATFNSAQNITYEQADTLAGQGINHTMLMEQILAQTNLHTSYQSLICEKMMMVQPDITSIKDNVVIIVETQRTMNGYLATISENTSVLPEMRDTLTRIRRNMEEA